MDEKKDVKSSAPVPPPPPPPPPLPPPPPPPPPPPVEVTRIWIGTGGRVAPKQVVSHHCPEQKCLMQPLIGFGTRKEEIGSC